MARLKAASRVWLAPIWGETGQLAAGTHKSPQGLPIPCAGKGLNLSPSKATSERDAPKGDHHANHHHQGRNRDLLQGLGHRTTCRLQPRLAARRRCLRGPDVFPRLAWLSLHRARSPWSWPLKPAMERQRHGHLCRRPCGIGNEARPQGRDPCRPLDRRRRGGSLHRASWNQARGQGGAHRRRASADAQDEGQSVGHADRGIRPTQGERHCRPVAVLEGSESALLRLQQVWRQSVGRRARVVLAARHVGRLSRLLFLHHGVFRDGP